MAKTSDVTNTLSVLLVLPKEVINLEIYKDDPSRIGTMRIGLDMPYRPLDNLEEVFVRRGPLCSTLQDGILIIGEEGTWDQESRTTTAQITATEEFEMTLTAERGSPTVFFTDQMYEGMGRPFYSTGREVANENHYEQRNFDIRSPVPADQYGRGVSQSPAAIPYASKGKGRASPPPPSSGNILDRAQEVEKERHPLHLNKDGEPTGNMVKWFHKDIVSFSKDLNPCEGWDGQALDAKQRMRDRLAHDY